MNSLLQKLLRNRVTLPHTPFYRLYPYRYGISINSADARGCISLETGFFCNRIPKAANSTIVENLARLTFGEDVPSRIAKKRFTNPSQLNVRQAELIEELFRFVIVRNPYTRTLSAYLDKVERRAKQKNRESSFKSFLEGLANGGLYKNAHWAPQNSLLLLPIKEFDFIGKVENLDEDLAYIKARLLGDRNQLETATAHTENSTGAVSKLASYYDNDCITLVKALYKEDFEQFDYPQEFPV